MDDSDISDIRTMTTIYDGLTSEQNERVIENYI